MAEISMTTFTDFILKSGTTKITCVREAKRRYQEGYDPARDFWRSLRFAIVQMHIDGLPKTSLDRALQGLTDRKKIALYPRRVTAYKRWMGRKNLEWEDPRRILWEHGELQVRVNPELSFRINGDHHTIKLYFKEEALSKNRVDTLLFLLQSSLSLDEIDSTPGILDVPRGKLIVPTREIENIGALLEGEALSFQQIWDRV